MKIKIHDRKPDEAAKKDVENKTNRNNANSNISYTRLKFVSFVSTMDEVIRSNL